MTDVSLTSEEVTGFYRSFVKDPKAPALVGLFAAFRDGLLAIDDKLEDVLLKMERTADEVPAADWAFSERILQRFVASLLKDYENIDSLAGDSEAQSVVLRRHLANAVRQEVGG